MTTLAMGVLFLLKFQRESTEEEYSLRLQGLINESSYDEHTVWEERQANYLKALAVLAEARDANVKLEALIDEVAETLKLPAPYRPALTHGLLTNLSLAEEYGLLTEENLRKIEHGEELRIKAGGYSGENLVVDQTVPYRYSPELEMRFANLLLKPESVVRRYPDQFGESALLVMTACRQSDLMSESSYARTLQVVRRTGIGG